MIDSVHFRSHVLNQPQPVFIFLLHKHLQPSSLQQRWLLQTWTKKMAEIKAEAGHDYPLIISDSCNASDNQNKQQKPKRVASLNIFRGLTVALMISVGDAGGDWPVIGHAPWNGCNLADFVMPFLLFIRISTEIDAVKKVIFRTLKLLFWGILLQGGFSHSPHKLTYGVDVKMIRSCVILRRIVFAYLVVALVEIFTENTNNTDQSPSWSVHVYSLFIWPHFMGQMFLIGNLPFITRTMLIMARFSL